MTFPRRGVYRQDAFGIRTRFPFGFFEKTRQVESQMEIVVYPTVAPTDQFYEVLPLLSGEMASFSRPRPRTAFAARYLPTDSARFVDWKVTARAGHLMVREFAREDERRVMLVLDPFIGPPPRPAHPKLTTEPPRSTPNVRARRLHGRLHRLALQRNQFGDAIPHEPIFDAMAPAAEIIYDALRELATDSAGYFCARRTSSWTTWPPSTKSSKSSSPPAPSTRFPPRCGHPRIFIFIDRL